MGCLFGESSLVLDDLGPYRYGCLVSLSPQPQTPSGAPHKLRKQFEPLRSYLVLAGPILGTEVLH